MKGHVVLHLIRTRLRRAAAAALVLVGACEGGTPAAPVATVPPMVAVRIRGPASFDLPIAAQRRLEVVSVDAAGLESPTTGVWRSSHPAIVAVDTPGVVRAIGYGEATVTVLSHGFEVSVQVATHPVGLSARVLAGPGPLVAGESYEVVAEFLDAGGTPTEMPWEIFWEVSPGAEVRPDPHTNRRARLLPQRAGTIELTVGSRHLRGKLPLGVLPADSDYLTVTHFSVHMGVNGATWWFAPDLVVSSPVMATVTRLEFAGVAPVCGVAPLHPSATPLFDFQPYNYVWEGDRLALGTQVEVAITVQLASGRTRVQRVSGPVVPFTHVIEHGTDGFDWQPCS